MPKLDFNQFHPIDHWPWESRCKEFYKGKFRYHWMYHIQLSWRLKHKENLRMFIYEHFLCPLGKHDARESWYPKQKQHVEKCLGCGKVTKVYAWRDEDCPLWMIRKNL